MVKVILFITFLILIIFLLLFGAIAFMCAPNNRRAVSAFYGRKFAHRGLHNKDVPENSMTAFRRARERNLGVELDVQMTRDKQLVVFHDGNLKRMCGVDGLLKDYSYEELSELRLNNTEEKIPLFSEVLKIIDGVDLICEIKSDNGVKNYELCQKTYDMLMTYSGNFCMESFSPFITGWFKKNHPEIIRGQLACITENSGNGRFVDFLLTNLMLNFISRPDFIAYDFHDISTFGYRFVKKIFNPFRICWTPKGVEEINIASKEFDTLIFEEFPSD